LQRRERLDLSTNVGRSVEQEPSLVVGAHRDRGLGARTAGTRAIAHGPTLRAAAVPLRKTSSRCRSEHTHPHTRPPFSLAGISPAKTGIGGREEGAGPISPTPYIHLFRIRPDTSVRSYLSAGPDFLELRGLPLLEFHGFHLLLTFRLCHAGSSSEMFLLVRWEA
jgi:hypothetical protein